MPWKSRRHVLLGAASVLALVPFAARADRGDGPRNWFFLPVGHGPGDGQSWQTAAAFRRAGTFAAEAQPGDRYCFAVPDGDLPLEWAQQRLVWTGGGRAGAPISLHFGTFHAPDGFAQAAAYADPPQYRMLGHETTPGERPDVGGAPFLVLGAGSSHVRISGPVYDRSGGDGFFNLNAQEELRDLAFSGIHARLAGRVIETERGTSVHGLTVEDCSALGLIRGFARFHHLTEGMFRNLDLDADFIDGGGGAVCQIISVKSGYDLAFENLRLAKAINQLAAEERGSSYIQGDGLVLEEATGAVTIENCHAADMGDGGFDLKSDGVYLRGCTATRCKLGIRVWSHNPANLAEDCRVTDPVRWPENDGSCLWVAGQLTARNCTLHARGGMSPIRFGAGADGTADSVLKIEGGEIVHEDGVNLVVGTAGQVELENVLLNGVETSGRFTWTGRRLRRHWGSR